MLNQSTADNIRNLNTHIKHKPRLVYDPAQRRAALAASVDALCKSKAVTDPQDINAWAGLAMAYLDAGHTPDTALAMTNESMDRVNDQLKALELLPASTAAIENIYKHQYAIRAAAQNRFRRKQARHQRIKRLLKHGAAATIAALLGMATLNTIPATAQNSATTSEHSHG